MTALLVELSMVTILMAIVQMLNVWLLTMLGYPFQLFDFKSIFFSSVFFGLLRCFWLFQTASISVNPPVLIPLVTLVIVAVVCAFALLGGYLGECVADFAIEKGQSKKR